MLCQVHCTLALLPSLWNGGSGASRAGKGRAWTHWCTASAALHAHAAAHPVERRQQGSEGRDREGRGRLVHRTLTHALRNGGSKAIRVKNREGRGGLMHRTLTLCEMEAAW